MELVDGPSLDRVLAEGPLDAARTVDVNQAALAGQPVGPVVRQLRQLGLQPEVTWVTTTQQPPGTVISVQPSGQLSPGSTVTVTAAQRPAVPPAGPGHGNGKGHGNGNGKG
jgi:beta-lactam-binding protein with PASTA domain